MAGHEEYLWRDPLAVTSAGPVLLSDQIHFLAEEVGLIDPFEPKCLRPASYDVRVGDSYYEDDVRKDLNDEANEIEIPPNGLVYVKTKERFNVPYYLVARYSLRVHQVYRGLLIDNGLHIDPGYSGYIWIPVHNFTMEPRVLSRGHEFISVEFNRTTRLPAKAYRVGSQEELVRLGIDCALNGSAGHPVRVFYKDIESFYRRAEEITPRRFWDKFPGEKHQSGTLATDQRILEVEDRVKKARDDTDGSLRTTNSRIDTFLTLIFTVVAVLFAGLGIVATTNPAERSFFNAPVIVAAVALFFALRADRFVGTGDQSRTRYGRYVPLAISGGILILGLGYHAWAVGVFCPRAREAKQQASAAAASVSTEKQAREGSIRDLEERYKLRLDELQRQVDQLRQTSKAK